MNTEPVALAAAARAVILCGVAWGLKASPEQIAATVLAVEVVSGLFVRGRVTPT